MVSRTGQWRKQRDRELEGLLDRLKRISDEIPANGGVISPHGIALHARLNPATTRRWIEIMHFVLYNVPRFELERGLNIVLVKRSPKGRRAEVRE